MTGTVEKRLSEAGLALPQPVAPVAAYVPFVQTGNLVFVSGQIPIGPDGTIKGHLTGASSDEEIEAAQAAARLCALNLLAHVKTCTGDLDRVKRVVKLTGFVSSDGTFTQHPQVINGASELMGLAFGDAGQHARAAVGSSSLPLGVVCEVEGIFEIG